eukprot:10734944-Heterocapsa_arctica.AAC.1
MGSLLCPSCDRWASPASIVMPPEASTSSSRSASSACASVRVFPVGGALLDLAIRWINPGA